MENILKQIKEGNIKDYSIVVKELHKNNVKEDHAVDYRFINISYLVNI